MITSKKNPRLQYIRDLLQNKKSRDENGQFIIEGVRLVEDAFNHGADILEVYYSNTLSDRGKQLLKEFEIKQIPVEEVDESVFSGIMDTSTSQGIAAVCSKPITSILKDLDFVIVADQLRDPGNLGTLIRTAVSAGAQAVLTTPDSVDLYSPKVLRSAMGAHFHISCVEMDWPSIAELKRTNNPKGMSAYVAAANGDMVCWQCNFTHPVMLIIGSEADGATEAAFRLADHRLSIPMPGKMESLNAAVAAGILIFEVVRQRTKL
jgi:TrmH family RNA methyltransferase